MTDVHDTTPSSADLAKARIRGFQEVFDNIRAHLLAQTNEIGTPQAGTPKAVMAKLGELHSAQLALLKAEEAFNERFGQDDEEVGVDFDSIRADLGRRLDRIRDARRAAGVSAEPE